MQISLRHPCIFEYRYFWCYERSDFSEKINSSRDELQRSLINVVDRLKNLWHNNHTFHKVNIKIYNMTSISATTNIMTRILTSEKNWNLFHLQDIWIVIRWVTQITVAQDKYCLKWDNHISILVEINSLLRLTVILSSMIERGETAV